MKYLRYSFGWCALAAIQFFIFDRTDSVWFLFATIGAGVLSGMNYDKYVRALHDKKVD